MICCFIHHYYYISLLSFLLLIFSKTYKIKSFPPLFLNQSLLQKHTHLRNQQPSYKVSIILYHFCCQFFQGFNFFSPTAIILNRGRYFYLRPFSVLRINLCPIWPMNREGYPRSAPTPVIFPPGIFFNIFSLVSSVDPFSPRATRRDLNKNWDRAQASQKEITRTPKIRMRIQSSVRNTFSAFYHAKKWMIISYGYRRWLKNLKFIKSGRVIFLYIQNIIYTRWSIFVSRHEDLIYYKKFN